MQRLNTALLVVVTVLLVILLLRPQAGRYQYLESGYLMDTTTGTVVRMKVGPDVAEYKRREKKKEEAAHQEWLAATCPDVLAGRSSKPNSWLSLRPDNPEREAKQRRECREWQQAQRTDTP